MEVTVIDNIITVDFGNENRVEIPPIYQYDWGIKISFVGIADGNVVQFSNIYTETTLDRKISDSMVEIPIEMLEDFADITAYVRIVDENYEIITKEIKIPVIKVAKPSNVIPSDEKHKPIVKELQEQIDSKQDKLVAGANITIKGNVISAPGGGTGGTSNYNDLENKPKINGVELNGNKTLEDLGIEIPEIPEFPEIPEVDLSDRAKTWSGTTAPTSGPSNAYEGVKSGDLYTDETNNILYRAFVYTPKNAPYSIVVWSEIANKDDVVETFNGFALPNDSDVQAVRTAKKNDLYHCDTDHSVWVYAQNDANDKEPWKKIYPVEVDGYSKEEIDQKFEEVIGDINTVLASVVGGVE